MKISAFFRGYSWRFNEVQLPKMSVDYIKILSSTTSATCHWIDNISHWKYMFRYKMIYVC